jgi:hypothetical protein
MDHAAAANQKLRWGGGAEHHLRYALQIGAGLKHLAGEDVTDLSESSTVFEESISLETLSEFAFTTDSQ